ncbi:MAG: hypothetical protein MHM6MM_005718 [Cercozoa sp. M6MM]
MRSSVARVARRLTRVSWRTVFVPEPPEASEQSPEETNEAIGEELTREHAFLLHMTTLRETSARMQTLKSPELLSVAIKSCRAGDLLVFHTAMAELVQSASEQDDSLDIAQVATLTHVLTHRHLTAFQQMPQYSKALQQLVWLCLSRCKLEHSEGVKATCVHMAEITRTLLSLCQHTTCRSDTQLALLCLSLAREHLELSKKRVAYLSSLHALWSTLERIYWRPKVPAKIKNAIALEKLRLMDVVAEYKRQQRRPRPTRLDSMRKLTQLIESIPSLQLEEEQVPDPEESQLEESQLEESSLLGESSLQLHRIFESEISQFEKPEEPESQESQVPLEASQVPTKVEESQVPTEVDESQVPTEVVEESQLVVEETQTEEDADETATAADSKRQQESQLAVNVADETEATHEIEPALLAFLNEWDRFELVLESIEIDQDCHRMKVNDLATACQLIDQATCALARTENAQFESFWIEQIEVQTRFFWQCLIDPELRFLQEETETCEAISTATSALLNVQKRLREFQEPEDSSPEETARTCLKLAREHFNQLQHGQTAYLGSLNLLWQTLR